MTFSETVALGALAGFTIYLGLPLARLRLLGDRSRVALAMFSVGVLAFLIAVSETDALALAADAARRHALSTGLAVAAAIGVHNFAEGLAIGVSAKAGEISLATVLIVGFALHNATEGFGIIGPLGGVRPSWRWLGLAGLIGGGPVFLGSVVGYNVTSHPLELTFYALAGGAILYVIGEVWQGMRRYGHRELGLLLLSAGFLVAVATDMLVAYGGG
jgi:ZIP family zinc transporter